MSTEAFLLKVSRNLALFFDRKKFKQKFNVEIFVAINIFQ